MYVNPNKPTISKIIANQVITPAHIFIIIIQNIPKIRATSADIKIKFLVLFISSKALVAIPKVSVTYAIEPTISLTIDADERVSNGKQKRPYTIKISKNKRNFTRF